MAVSDEDAHVARLKVCKRTNLLSNFLRKNVNKSLDSLALMTYHSDVCLMSNDCLFYMFSAVLFFAISAFFELLCVILHAFTFPKLPIVKHFRAKAALKGSKTVSADLAAAGIHRVANEVCNFSKHLSIFLSNLFN